MKFPNNDIILAAIELLGNQQDIVKDGGIESKYSSYIASFGGSIVQVGLVGTLIIFEANKEKKKIVNLLFSLYNSNFPSIQTTNDNYHQTLANNSSYNPTQIKEIRNKLVDTAVCLKLAMRCYKKTENQ